MRSIADLKSMSNDDRVRLAFGMMGVDPSHQNPKLISKTWSDAENGYNLVFQCPACGCTSSNDGLSQPCPKAQLSPDKLPPWGNWEPADDDHRV